MSIFIYLFFSFAVNAQTEIIDAKKSILLLTQQLKDKPSSGNKFRVDLCEKIRWDNLLMITKKTELRFEFKEGCDIKGVVNPKLLSWFPIELELRNIPNYNQIKANGLISAVLETNPVIRLDIKEASLHNEKKSIAFEGSYKVRIGQNGKKALVQKLGGEIILTGFGDQKILPSEKILIK